MFESCASCGEELPPALGEGWQATTLCASCAGELSQGGCDSRTREILDTLDVPILLMESNPRQVLTANRRARDLFGKDLSHLEAHRGGQVFDCIHSFTEAGCGKDVNCEDCKIKEAIIETFISKTPRVGISATLQVKKNDGLKDYALRVSTESVGDLALVRIDQYEEV